MSTSRGGARIKVKLSFQSVRRVLQGAWNLCRTQAPQLSSRASRHTEQVPSSQGSPRTSWLPSFSPVCPCGCALPSPTVYTRFLLKWVGEGSYCLLLKNPISENTLLRLGWGRTRSNDPPLPSSFRFSGLGKDLRLRPIAFGNRRSALGFSEAQCSSWTLLWSSGWSSVPQDSRAA